MRVSKLVKLGALVAIAVALAAVIVLAVLGVPAPPAIAATGVPRIPWTPIAEGISFVGVLTEGDSFVDWHPSGDRVIVRTAGLRSGALYRITEQSPRREKVICRGTGAVKFNPDHSRNYLIYLEDNAGDEYHQVYFRDLNTNETRLLSDGASRHFAPQFDPAGERLAFLSRAPKSEGTAFHVVSPLHTDSLRTICRQPGDWGLGEWSPDGGRLLAFRITTPNRGFQYSLDVGNGEIKKLGSGDEGEVSHGAAVWSHDGATFTTPATGIRNFNRCAVLT